MKKKYIGLICVFAVFFVCSCGEGIKKDTTVAVKESVSPKKKLTDAEKKNTPVTKSTSTPKPSNKPENRKTSEPTEDPHVLFRKKNVKIAGRHYTYIDYKVEVGGISLYSLKTKDPVLHIPARIDGKPVWFIEGRPDQYSWQKNRKNRLKKIIIPEGVREIYRMEKVAADEIVLPKSLKKVHMLSFEKADIKKVVMNNPGTNIGQAAFLNSKLKQIEFPNGFCGKLEERCFKNTRLTEFHWPNYSKNAKERMEREVFVGCKKLKKIIFPENQKHIYIPYNTFWGCIALKQLIFPASTKKVTYKECYYADDYKNGISTLVFKGKNTKVVGGNVEELDYGARVPKGRNFITVKTIIAPKNSQAYKFAKNAVQISYMTEWKPDRDKDCDDIHISISKENFIAVKFKTL